jgi:hypothetical protein
MSHHQSTRKLPAPCIVDRGIVVDKRDIQKLLSGLGCVHYVHSQDGKVASRGEGVVVEVFADAQQATLIANHALYLNVCSFDYLELKQTPHGDAQFVLVQDRRHLQLQPMADPLSEVSQGRLDEEALEAVFDRVLLANWDAHHDDEERFFL